MSKMVERVAKALFNSEQEAFPARVRREPFDDMDEVSGVAARYRFLARAAIAATKDPDDELIDNDDKDCAASLLLRIADAAEYERAYVGEHDHHCDAVRAIFNAAIDAALK